MNNYNIPVVMYHSVNDRPDENPLGFLSFSSAQFTEHLRYFMSRGFKFINFKELLMLAVENRLGCEKTVVLTFDDGFLDNLLVAEKILNWFNCKATIFVNPEFVAEGPVRSFADNFNCWGQLNWAELRALQQRRVFDIQSHTMSHDWEFEDDKVVDFYSPQKHLKYFWLAWKLFPQDKPFWVELLEKHKYAIPTGYPVFKKARTLTARRFEPSQEFIEQCMAAYRQDAESALEKINRIECKGRFETQKQWFLRAEHLISDSKKIIENKLEKEVDFICFPGGSYNQQLVQIAKEAGFKGYMLSSREENFSDNVENIKSAIQYGELIKIRRLSFSKDYPSILPQKIVSYWSVKLKVETFMGNRVACCVNNILRFVRDVSGRFMQLKHYLSSRASTSDAGRTD